MVEEDGKIILTDIKKKEVVSERGRWGKFIEWIKSIPGGMQWFVGWIAKRQEKAS